MQKYVGEAVIFVSIFLHFSTNRRIRASFWISKYVVDDNNIICCENLMEQSFRNIFPSKILKIQFFCHLDSGINFLSEFWAYLNI